VPSPDGHADHVEMPLLTKELCRCKWEYMPQEFQLRPVWGATDRQVESANERLGKQLLFVLPEQGVSEDQLARRISWRTT
jgi:hypothetical protein